MLDMMALAGAHHVVGFSASTFSWYLREIRCLLGSPVSVRIRFQGQRRTSAQTTPSRCLLGSPVSVRAVFWVRFQGSGPGQSYLNTYSIQCLLGSPVSVRAIL